MSWLGALSPHAARTRSQNAATSGRSCAAKPQVPWPVIIRSPNVLCLRPGCCLIGDRIAPLLGGTAVAARIRHGLKYVAADRLVPAPDCGMKYMPRNVAFGKLKEMCDAAAIVRPEVS